MEYNVGGLAGRLKYQFKGYRHDSQMFKFSISW